ncbi:MULTISPECIES: hypothetical protein [Haloarcula]|jgi:hypothetical protein|uniref:DUF8160 domain-containing protein n=1 Tax=Haloarcula marismortui ATCC 33799 TaxID=662475 RepID=M0JUW7_9EURY|nr:MULTISPECIES: hypothetical protein [Haloarcula]EMA12957.1 hypothetical protein C435_16715 [Haloarcula californiae ATCC 33799]NHN66205.1 hypothetical protein [Haloarcula sp. JP-Z28]
MSDDDVLRDRFRSHQPDQTDSTDNTNDANDTSETDMADVAHETQETDTTEETSVRERKQEAMYLRPRQRERLREFYDELDGRSKVAGEGGLAKNDDFYEAFVAFVLDERREEFIEYLDLDEL